MNQIISEEGMILESHGQPVCLPKLETLWVTKCGELEYIFPILVARGLQLLEWLKLRDLPRLKKVFGQNREGEVGDCEVESHHQTTGFPKLKTIEVVNCENLEYIFPISIARDLPQLESLELRQLPQLKQVFGHEGGDDGDGNNSVLSKLQKPASGVVPQQMPSEQQYQQAHVAAAAAAQQQQQQQWMMQQQQQQQVPQQ